ncbi:alkaline phosphatase family protein [Flavobacterium sp. RSP46]|uniref:alkaline phosphatase family protein n=1 Tax=Flavobacterium sp. RSP46 TaxID=2497486 RepID=UPI000F85D04E|nr:alkaline phosphatase family protein [Flavobacterium sp. RSP46]RTY91391.1 alkaline phosphatase family protein [Flavobacterium sp. RSP46]
MKIVNKSFLILSLTLLVSTTSLAQKKVEKSNVRTLVVFFDGLRPDYITPELMPNVYLFSKKGSYGKQHHSVFPTVTRVNASSLSTGCYPGSHGLMGNTVYFPQINETAGLNTGEAEELNKISKATDNHLLTSVSLGEVLEQNGKSLFVFSSGSTGQALMQNHKVSGGAIINTSMILPESMQAKILSEIGTVPMGLGKHKWLTDAVIKYGLTLDGPLVSTLWYGDPDSAAHKNGIGSPEAIESIKYVDEQFGRIIKSLQLKGLDQNFNVIISSDHGFVTHIGKLSLADFLIQQGLKKDKESTEVVVAEGAVYVKDHDEKTIKNIVAALQEQNWIGGIYTKALKEGDVNGFVEGTLSFESIYWDHGRSGDVLVDMNWNDNKNDAGYAGTSFAKGVAGHGGFSPYEIHIALLANGPSFKNKFEGNLPTSNVDIIPTVLHLHNLTIPKQMDGRVMYELLTEKVSNNVPLTAKIELIKTEVKLPWGVYKLEMERSVLGKYNYPNFTRVVRVKR